VAWARPQPSTNLRCNHQHATVRPSAMAAPDAHVGYAYSF